MRIPQPNLQTTRLLLRPLVETDAARISELASDPEIVNNTRSIETPFDLHAAQAWLAQRQSNWEQGVGVSFGIVQKVPPQIESPLVGAIGMSIDSENEKAELGYWLGKDFRNQGYCCEAGVAMLDFGFSSLGLNKISAHSLQRNVASSRVLEKQGFEREGVSRSHIKKGESLEDVVFYGLLRSDWNRRD